MTMPVEEQNKKLFYRWFTEVWNRGRYDVAYEVIDANFTVHGAGGQVVKQGPDGVIGLIKTWRDAFPDGQMTIDGLVAEGSLVAALLTWRGTHLESFYGIPASGKVIEVTSIGIDRILNGKVLAGWGEVDMLGMMQQMNALPQFPAQSAFHSWGAPSANLTDQIVVPSPDENKLLMQRFIQSVNDDDVEAAYTVIDVENYVEHNPSRGILNFAQTWQAYAAMRSSLPDLHFELAQELRVSSSNLVATRSMVTGTHTGTPLFGIPASGKKVDWTSIDVSRSVNGKIVERWLCTDTLRLVQQLGAVPAGT